MFLDPVRDLLKGVERILSSFRNQLGGQFLVGNSTNRFASVRPNQGGDVSPRSFCVQNSLQRSVEIRFGNLCLVRQSGQSLNHDAYAIDRDTAVIGSGANQNVNHLVRNIKGGAVDLYAFENVGFTASGYKAFNLFLQCGKVRLLCVIGLYLLGKGLKCRKFYEFCGVISH